MRRESVSIVVLFFVLTAILEFEYQYERESILESQFLKKEVGNGGFVYFDSFKNNKIINL